jgi:hypothetical protein
MKNKNGGQVMVSGKVVEVPCVETSVLEHPHFFPRMLVTDKDLVQEQSYLRDKARRHNRLLHGWGVVCGACVRRAPLITALEGCAKDDTSSNAKEPPDPLTGQKGDQKAADLDPWRVLITPGYILGPCGEEIVIPCQQIFDVRQQCVTVVPGDPCAPGPDPWCSEVLLDTKPGTIYVAVRYKEILARPVRVQPVGCGCDEIACEYSRIRDAFEICSLDQCPESHHGPPPKLEVCPQLAVCPPCPDEPWVVLATVEIGTDGIQGDPDNASCRRWVLSLATYWCRTEAAKPPKAEDEKKRERVG